MRLPALVATGQQEIPLRELASPLDLETLAMPAGAPWEVELGFGKGKYLLRQAAAYPERRFLGIEVVSKYFRLVRRRALHRGLSNISVIRAEALYLLSTNLPRGFAEVLHVYFPDPWPKSRHHKRRLFDRETVDLVLGILKPGGQLFFATDFLDYGERVVELLEGFPSLAVERRDTPWTDGARTNYEAKYIEEGRPILRLSGQLDPQAQPGALHPAGSAGIVAACAHREPEAAQDSSEPGFQSETSASDLRSISGT